MAKRKQEKKLLPAQIAVLAVAILGIISGNGDGAAIVAVLGMIVIAFGIFKIVLLAMGQKSRTGGTVHTHDRIDHKSDTRINPRTGKAEYRPVQYSAPHSQQEHWKQQLDGLLENGTIDRAEYREMLKRKF